MVKKTSNFISEKIPYLTIGIITLSLIGFFFENLASVWIYDRVALLHAEYWRIFSAHIVHFSYMHLVLNLIAFSIAGWIIEKRAYPCFGWLIFFMSFSISVSMLILKPNMIYFGGLSGLAHGAIYYLALFGLREKQPWRIVSQVIIIVVPIKIALELYQESSILTKISQEMFITMPLSHMIGVITALFLFLVIQVINLKRIVIETDS